MAVASGKGLALGMLAAFSPGLLILPAFIAIVVLIVWASVVQARKTRERLAAFAQRAGLRVNEQTVLGFISVESLEGEQSGRTIRYWTYATGSGKSRVTWVAVGVIPRAGAGLEFDLSGQDFGSKILEMFGAKEVKVGDPAFDAAWFVRTNQPEFFAAALVPQIRERLMASIAIKRGARYKLEKGVVQYVERGTFGGSGVIERLEGQLPLLHELADVAEVFGSASR